MEKTYFFRDICNLVELQEKTSIKRENHSMNFQKYEVINTIHLDEPLFGQFCSNFKYNYDFLFPYIEGMQIINNVWRCILIISNGNDGILVFNSGYLFPKFTALPLVAP